MDASASVDNALDQFLERSRFASTGGVITDLDGTAVVEAEGRVAIAPGVIDGLKRLAAAGRPLVLNTLRFPLNVVRTFGRAWYEISSQPVPLVSLNGAVLGVLDLDSEGQIVFRERDAAPIDAATLAAVNAEIAAILADGAQNLLVFFYPRDWTRGEAIWAATPEARLSAQAKYLSASEVFTGPPTALEARLASCEPLMLFLLFDAPADRLMAYQHAKPGMFVTASGVDKLAGANRAASIIGFDFAESVGAGDTPMDTFLDGVGFGLHVGPLALPFRARYGDVRLSGPAELGALLGRLHRETA